MGLASRIAGWFKKSSSEDVLWGDRGWSSPSVTGITVNQYTALNSSAVLAATTMLAEDVAKLPWTVIRKADDESQAEAKDHFLYDLLQEPNDWMNGLELREMLQIGIILRGNGYAIIKRNARGFPVALIPWNPDRVMQWMATSGELFYRLVAHNIHEQALLASLGAQLVGSGLLPSDDMLHIRGFSLDGLAGMSRISLAREAVALGLAQEQQAARWMGQGAKPSGMLTTDQKLTVDAARRLAADFKDNSGGLQNSGKVIVGEQGLKFLPFSMTSQDLEFIASRQFQMQEIARIFRIPPHMMGELSRSTNNNISQQAQEYINYTLTGYTNRWRAKLSSTFGLRKQNLSVEFDYRALTQADMTARINNWRIAIMSMIAKPDEARIDLGMKPEGGEANKLHFPQNMAAAGSQSTGNAPEDAGRPPSDAPKQFEQEMRELVAESSRNATETARAAASATSAASAAVTSTNKALAAIAAREPAPAAPITINPAPVTINPAPITLNLTVAGGKKTITTRRDADGNLTAESIEEPPTVTNLEDARNGKRAIR